MATLTTTPGNGQIFHDGKDLSAETTGQNWFFKYKLYHLLFWCIYHYLWWVIAVGNPFEAASSIFFSPYAAKFIFYVIFQAIVVYFNLYFLIPRYLEKSRFAEYIIYLIVSIICASGLIVSGYYVGAFLSEKTFLELYKVEPSNYLDFFKKALPSTVASSTLAMSIKLTKNWIETKRRQQHLEKEKLETELKFLKYQFNPHFLFNTINSIFFLIHKNPDMASASLAKFSELLRYQLYECNDIQISLNKEITYLENFIQLEKLRRDHNLEVTFKTDQQPKEHCGIAPFILMTFVENAFKHVSKHKNKPNWIRIKVETDQEQLHFSIANSTSPDASTDVVNYGGIGLQNVKRRLELIYPDKYKLAIKRDETSFEVNLQLEVCELAMSHSMLEMA